MDAGTRKNSQKVQSCPKTRPLLILKRSKWANQTLWLADRGSSFFCDLVNFGVLKQSLPVSFRTTQVQHRACYVGYCGRAMRICCERNFNPPLKMPFSLDIRRGAASRGVMSKIPSFIFILFDRLISHQCEVQKSKQVSCDVSSVAWFGRARQLLLLLLLTRQID